MVQPHLDALWDVLAAAGGATLLADTVAAQLLEAYGELRQTEFLLRSLLTALRERPSPAATALACSVLFSAALQKVRSLAVGQEGRELKPFFGCRNQFTLHSLSVLFE